MRAPEDVAVVGGGVAGLSCALQLARQGLRVAVFDMGTRAVGGRCSSRAMDGGVAFDHGCQLLAQPRSTVFRETLEAWVAAGVVQQWTGRFGRLERSAFLPLDAAAEQGTAASGRGFFGSLQPGPLYTGVPSMQSLCTHMARQLEEGGRGRVALSRKVEAAAWDPQQQTWRLRGSLRGRAAAAVEGGSAQQAELGEFKALVLADSLLALPDSAGYAELQGAGPAVSAITQQIREGLQSDPVFCLMAAFGQPLGPAVPFDAAVVASGPFQWVSCNSSKPGRPAGSPQCWVAITTPDYARQLMDRFPLHVGGKYNPQTRGYLEGVAPVLLAEFEQLMAPFMGGAGQGLPQPAYLHTQRWGRGFVRQPLGQPCLAAPQQRFAACGDFCLGPTVEDAFMSGAAAAAEVAGVL